MTVDGLHVPVIPSSDVAGSVGDTAFWQYEFAMVGKVGLRLPTIVMFKETGVAQPAADDGVNLYAEVPMIDVLMLAGLQVPATPSFDVAGGACAVEF